MPRDPAKLKKADLLEELREKHGVETVEVEREVTVDPGPGEDFEPFEETRPVRVDPDELTREELLKRYRHLLDTTTEKERERFTREAVERENAEAEIALRRRAEAAATVEGDDGDLREE